MKTKGPLLLASNHPNSFLDGVVYDVLFSEPIWSLARGDFFKSKWAARVLHSLKMYPVFRDREGMENLTANYKTFDASLEVFKKGGLVTIFSEGDCVNAWELRSLKKGTARLAFRAWEVGIPLKILPIGINYSAFRRFGKQIDVNPGTVFTWEGFDLHETDGHKYQAFNKKLTDELRRLVYDIPPGDRKHFNQKFGIKPNRFREAMLWAPAALGWLLHAPFYYPLKALVKRLCHDNQFFDSLLFSFFIFLYPVYLVFLAGATVFFINKEAGVAALLLLPLSAVAYTKRKLRKDRIFER